MMNQAAMRHCQNRFTRRYQAAAWPYAWTPGGRQMVERAGRRQVTVPGTRAQEVAPTQEPQALQARRPGWPVGSAELLCRHWLAAALLGPRLVLRVLAQIAPHPPLAYRR